MVTGNWENEETILDDKVVETDFAERSRWTTLMCGDVWGMNKLVSAVLNISTWLWQIR